MGNTLTPFWESIGHKLVSLFGGGSAVPKLRVPIGQVKNHRWNDGSHGEFTALKQNRKVTSVSIFLELWVFQVFELDHFELHESGEDPQIMIKSFRNEWNHIAAWFFHIPSRFHVPWGQVGLNMSTRDVHTRWWPMPIQGFPIVQGRPQTIIIPLRFQ
jgi:hypothetical protein